MFSRIRRMGATAFDWTIKIIILHILKNLNRGVPEIFFYMIAVFQLKQYEAVENLKNKRKKGL